MIELSLSQIAHACQGRLISTDMGATENRVERVVTDTRKECQDAVFFALVGENFDGHQYVSTAIEKGVACVVVAQEQSNCSVAQVVVDDTEKALGLLAQYVRLAVNPFVIGITGSAGKTTVKEMTASILRLEGQTLATQGNFNNHIGVPLTLLELTHADTFAVIEMGANHQGEIAYCASLALPNVVAVNNVAPAHIEGFGSIDGVAKAKYEIYQSLEKTQRSSAQAETTAVFNGDDHYGAQWATQENLIAAGQKLTVSCHNNAHFQADNIQTNPNDEVSFEMVIQQAGQSVRLPIELPMVGSHNVGNALMAAALASAAGATVENIQQGLSNVPAVQGRLVSYRGFKGCRVIDDSYNASVISVKAAADYIAQTEQGILVLGDMAELGAYSEQYHREVGSYAKTAGVSRLFATGSDSQATVAAFGNNGQWFEDKEQLIKALIETIGGKETILIKGSRSARMEQVVVALTEEHTTMGDGQAC